jgi:16S rRNA (guanine527-N7)-methyltransferase
LALARPTLAVTVLESNHKKAAFLRQAKLELGLANVTVVAERAEHWQPTRSYDLVVSRACAELPDFFALARRFVAPGGALLAMKGLYPHDELVRLDAQWGSPTVLALQVPELGETRHLVRLAVT